MTKDELMTVVDALVVGYRPGCAVEQPKKCDTMVSVYDLLDYDGKEQMLRVAERVPVKDRYSDEDERWAEGD